MKVKGWLICLASGIFLGVVIYGTFLYHDISTMRTAQAAGSTDPVLTTMLTSYTRWKTLQGEMMFTWYGDDGKTQIYRQQFAVSQPASATIDITNLSQPGLNESITISDGQAIYSLDKAAKTYTRGSFAVPRRWVKSSRERFMSIPWLSLGRQCWSICIRPGGRSSLWAIPSS